MSDNEYASLDADVIAEVDASVEFARTSPEPEVEDWDAAIYAA